MARRQRRRTAPDPLHDSVLAHVSTDFSTLHDSWTIHESLERIRARGVGERIVYFYVLDADDRLVGVVPTRRLLTAPCDRSVRSIMIERVVSIPQSATLLEACEWFVLHKFLAFPVVDDDRHIVGVIDVGAFSGEVLDIAERRRTDEIFDAIGFRVSQVRDASPFRAFRFRFPWLIATISSGIICAFIAGSHETTLANALVLAFFLTLVLGLGESVSIQTVTVSIATLHSRRPTLRWYLSALRREIATAVLLGLASGLVVGSVVWAWRGAPLEACAIGASLFLILCMACFLGLSVPALLHTLRLDPQIAAGPLTLALADIFTLIFYFAVASILL